MQCQESNKMLDAYVDNEIDVLQSVALEEHVASCAECQQKLQSRQALRKSIHGAGLRYTAPPELVRDVRKALRMSEEKSAGPRWAWFRSAAWGFAAATALFALVAVSVFVFLRNSTGNLLAQQSTDAYIRSMMAENHGMDVISAESHTVKPWFNGRVSFSPKVVDFADKGFALAGGRVDYLDGQRAAVLVYRRNQHMIDVFIYPNENNSGLSVRQERGYNIASWSKDGMQYWVVSDLNQAEMQQLAGLLRE